MTLPVTQRRELDRTVLSVLADADLDVIRGNGGAPFVEYAYFEPAVDHSRPDSVT